MAFVATVVVTDWRWRRIPNLATYPAMALGLALAAAEGVPGELWSGGLVDHLAALAAAFLLPLPFYVVGGVKAGDVKLLMAVGALEGLRFFLTAFVIGALLGGAYAVGYVLVRRFVWQQPFGEAMRAFMPYGVWLGFGALAALGLGVAR